MKNLIAGKTKIVLFEIGLKIKKIIAKSTNIETSVKNSVTPIFEWHFRHFPPSESQDIIGIKSYHFN